MTSKSPKELYQTVSKNLQSQGLDIDEKTVKAFNTFLFGKIREMQASFKHIEIYVPKLGIWKMRRLKMERYYNIMKGRKVGQLADSPEEAERYQEVFEKRIEKVRELCDRHEDMLLAKANFKGYKHELRTNKGSSKKQIEDLGRAKEQDLEEGTRGEDS